MYDTHFITIPKDEFDKIEIGDRLVIGNDEDHFGLVVYITDENTEKVKNQ